MVGSVNLTQALRLSSDRTGLSPQVTAIPKFSPVAQPLIVSQCNYLNNRGCPMVLTLHGGIRTVSIALGSVAPWPSAPLLRYLLAGVT